ncbi:MAG: PEP-CTERM sorting domain-containing protein [Pirellulales bacterium]
MNSRLISSFAFAAFVANTIATPALADNVKNISTGIVDGTGLKIDNNDTDTDFVIGAGGTGGLVGSTPIARSTPLPNPYVQDGASPNSRWIAIYTGSEGEGLNAPFGTYFFDTTVNLTGFRAATAQIPSLRYATDDRLVGIYVNDDLVYSKSLDGLGEFDGFRDLGALGLGNFEPGVNKLRFEVINSLNGTPLAFRLEGSVVASVPEPSGILLGLLGAATVGLVGIRRRRNH